MEVSMDQLKMFKRDWFFKCEPLWDSVGDDMKQGGNDNNYSKLKIYCDLGDKSVVAITEAPLMVEVKADEEVDDLDHCFLVDIDGEHVYHKWVETDLIKWCGYKWDHDGQSWLIGNSEEDYWALDDLIFGAFFFDYIKEDHHVMSGEELTAAGTYLYDQPDVGVLNSWGEFRGAEKHIYELVDR
jgi:hypothetical protein